MDTGAFSNLLSVRAGRQVSKVSAEDQIRVHGVSGAVDKVYSSDNATLTFAGMRQANRGIITLDFSTLSRHMGTEISGFLGFAMLRELEVELDYRDGIVHFKYDPKRVNRFVR